ncbi:MAG TPA: DUF302 domain-containing protein [Mycobacteriales bacterium]|nr:DUF302 domain-containing protein [Mycobacteriales bacterium]
MTLLYFDGCPNWRQAEDHLRTALRRVGASDVVVRRREVCAVDEAERLGFGGSPTVLLDGVDPFAEPGVGALLSCRVYREDYVILGACNPELAHRALGVDRAIGLLLPCNVVVRSDDDGSIVEFLDPEIMVSVPGRDELRPVAEEAGRRLSAARDALTR